jgi:hypothetical protein
MAWELLVKAGADISPVRGKRRRFCNTVIWC